MQYTFATDSVFQRIVRPIPIPITEQIFHLRRKLNVTSLLGHWIETQLSNATQGHTDRIDYLNALAVICIIVISVAIVNNHHHHRRPQINPHHCLMMSRHHHNTAAVVEKPLFRLLL